MKPHLGMIFLLLLIGAVLNVCIAWSLATFVQLGSTFESSPNLRASVQTLVADTSYAALAPRSYEKAPIHGSARAGVDAAVWILRPDSDAPDISVVDVEDRGTAPRTLIAVGVGRIRAGWPLRALAGSVVVGAFEWTTVPPEYQYATPIPVEWQPDDWFTFEFGGKRPLPLRPLWPGFIVNSITYAAVLYGVLFSARAIRRIRRRRTGRCGGCGYPVGSSPVCTECGDPLPEQRMETLSFGRTPIP